MSRSEVLFMVTGSIAAYKAVQVVSRLVQAGHGVQVAASESALKFVGAATWEGLSGRPVARDLFEDGHAMDHIHLVRKADIIVVAPATAHFLNRIVSGVGDDLMTTMFLAHDFKKPFLVAPAMNTSMYLHPITQRSLTILKDMGVEILESASGVLACGENGYGRLLEPDLILAEIQRALAATKTKGSSGSKPSESKVAHGPAENLNILITAGGTREPIDGVRFITNTSTGMTGANLAERLSTLGFKVHLLRAASGAPCRDSDVSEDRFESFDDLERELKRLLSTEKFTHVIHAAAVSDYRVERVVVDGDVEKSGKIPSGRKVSLDLIPTPKLISSLKKWSGQHPVKVAGFKLTVGASAADREQAAGRVLEHSDIVVTNDMKDIDREKGIHPFVIRTKKTQIPLQGLDELAGWLAQWIQERN